MILPSSHTAGTGRFLSQPVASTTTATTTKSRTGPLFFLNDNLRVRRQSVGESGTAVVVVLAGHDDDKNDDDM